MLCVLLCSSLRAKGTIFITRLTSLGLPGLFEEPELHDREEQLEGTSYMASSLRGFQENVGHHLVDFNLRSRIAEPRQGLRRKNKNRDNTNSHFLNCRYENHR